MVDFGKFNLVGLKITILAVGDLKESYWQAAASEYSRRLSGYLELQVVELRERVASGQTAAEILATEAAAIHGYLDRQSKATPLILLEIAGRSISSADLAARLQRQAGSGEPALIFIIGGSWGVDASVRTRATERISLGAMTLPHSLARIVLLEQLYRACRINRGEPYHK